MIWRSVRNPVCPDCGGDILKRSDGKTDPEGSPDIIDQHKDGKNEILFAWACDKCGFQLLGESRPEKIMSRVIRYRNEHIKEQRSKIPDPEATRLIARHRLASRFYFLLGVCVFAGSIHKFTMGAGMVISLAWMGVSAIFWLFGMKKSYHAWLVTTSNLFSSGVFKFWLLNEKWLI